MNAKLITAASLVIPNQKILINVVSRRVRQLSLGHRPLVECPPGFLAADIALTEIISKKLTYALKTDEDQALERAPEVIAFPGKAPTTKKAAA
jgi:DNA-directed RNA polymerase subunit omega